MSLLHRYIGFVIPVAFFLLFVAAVVALIRNRPPGDWFWNLVGGLQVILGIQVVVGAVLFVAQQRPSGGWLHYGYGGLFPAIVLGIAHVYGRRYPEIPWVVFGLAGFVCFGLTGRALMTGLGIGT